MVILATAATLIASQAVISGASSLSQQGMQLSLLPRLDIQQTSTEEDRAVYVPHIHWLPAVMVPHSTSLGLRWPWSRTARVGLREGFGIRDLETGAAISRKHG